MQSLYSVIRFALSAALLATKVVVAQSPDRPLGAHLTTRPLIHAPVSVSGVNIHLKNDLGIASDRHPMPTWLKWGIVGAGAGAITFAVLGRVPSNPNPVLQDAAVGAVVGFVAVGGGIAFYNWVCGAGSGSRRAGLCGR
jgi:hypothetical protein